jgi:DNA end-binding protein Ku
MAPRPYWKGYLRLSLVSCAVRLYNATTRSERVSFHLLNPKTHNRIQLKPHDAETGKELERAELVRGYEVEKGRYVIVDEAELDAIEVESAKTIDLTRFVEDSEIDPSYVDSPYYLAPDGKIADETFRVIQEAMRQEKKAGIGRIVLSRREHPVLLRPRGRGILLTTLRPADEVRSDTAYFEDIGEGKLDDEMVQLARRIIEQKSGPFDADELTGDRYQAALRELVEHKLKGEKPVEVREPQPGNVVNLMDALRRSLGGGDDRKPPAPSRRKAERTVRPRKQKARRSG